jgi:hypothetical protein
MTSFAACVSALVVTLFVTAPAGAAIRHETDKLLLPANPAFPALSAQSAQSEQASYDQMFLEQGIEPGSSKAQIVRAWVEKIQHDPVITAAIPGGANGISRVFLDPETRENVMSSGLARLCAADRLSYVQLLTRFLDELVPVNCFGEVDTGAAMNTVTLREMSDADARQYFELLYKVLTGDARKSPVVLPTPQQYAFAQRQLSRALLLQLGGNQSDVARYEIYATNPSLATPADACWATRITLHAIISMADPERDFILLRAILQEDQRAGSQTGERTGAPGDSRTPPSTSVPSPIRTPAR